MSNTVTTLHKKAVKPDISRLLKNNPELADYIAELESDNDFLRSVVDQQRARIMELTYVGGYIEVAQDLNVKRYRKTYDLETRTTADWYSKIYKFYHKQLQNFGWPRMELSKKDISRARHNAIEQAMNEKCYSPDIPRKAKSSDKKKNTIPKDTLREIMPTPYKVDPELVLADDDHHYKVLLEKKKRTQEQKTAANRK